MRLEGCVVGAKREPETERMDACLRVCVRERGSRLLHKRQITAPTSLRASLSHLESETKERRRRS